MKPALLLMLASMAAFLVPMRAADPEPGIYFSAAQLKELAKQAASRVNPEAHLGSQRLVNPSFLLYRDGNSQAEIHTERADMIVVQDGEGTVIVGGKMIDGKPSGPGEIRGSAIEGGTKYALTAGDMLYVPPNTVHQFVIEKGKHFTAAILKILPRE
ncbi:MAG TPA: hypothetical protein VGN17_08170 [Bryobacteraceae bacterium]|jgi:mannose-6-phosphate isomerase-like protein (cupin superfamily)